MSNETTITVPYVAAMPCEIKVGDIIANPFRVLRPAVFRVETIETFTLLDGDIIRKFTGGDDSVAFFDDEEVPLIICGT